MKATKDHKKKTVGLFFGGISNEAEISMMSAANIVKHFDVRRFDLKLIYWHTDNRFYRIQRIDDLTGSASCKPRLVGGVKGRNMKQKTSLPGSPALWAGSFTLSAKNQVPIENLAKLIDVALLITHGKYGEDGVLQGILESQGIPYCGCKVLSSSLCMDKAVSKRLLEGHGIRQVKFDFINLKDKSRGDIPDWLAKIEKEFALPVYVKPSNSGSSVGITRVDHFKKLKQAVLLAGQHDSKIIVEQGLVNPREVEVAILGNGRLIVSEPGELCLVDDFYSFDDKYKKNQTKVMIPAKLPAKMKQEIKNTARKAYELLDCRGFARIDFLIKGNRIFLNEINTLPGFTDISMYPMLMQHAGVSYKQLINRIISLAG